MATQDPVARIQDFAVIKGNHLPCLYKEGEFKSVMVLDKMSGNALDVPAIIARRGGQMTAAVAHEGMLLYVGDLVRTGPHTLMAIEFLIGGRVSVNRSTCVEIINERSVADGWMGWRRAFLKTLNVWTESERLKQPLEIQTNGGTMGIKG